MIKKLFLVTIFCSLLFSCGKKANPEYKVGTNNNLILRL